MSITMEELAKLANVSQGAVSLVLNGKAKGQISQKKQDLILSLAKKHNYRMNMAAKVLRKQKQYAIGVIMPATFNMFYASLISLLQQKLSQHGYMTFFSFFLPDNFEEVYDSLYSRQVDGIISCQESTLLQQGDIPTVVFCNDINERMIPSKPKKHLAYCGFEFNNAYNELFEHLYLLGHRKIGFLGNTKESRCVLLEKFLRNKNISNSQRLFFHCKDEFDGNNTLLKDILSLPDGPTAIITTNDETARQLISIGTFLGRKFPQDLSVVGFMNLPCAQSMYPALSTFDSCNEELTNNMVKMLLSMIERQELDVEDVFIQPKLILRDSCGKVN